MDQPFVTKFGAIKALLAAVQPDKPVKGQPQPLANVTIQHPTTQNLITDLFYSDANSRQKNRGFLFVPAYTVRGRFSLAQNTTGVFSDDELTTALHTDESLNSDILVTAGASEAICALNDINIIVDPPAQPTGAFIAAKQPIQSYLITSSGVLRICEGLNTGSQAEYYGRRFKATSFFPERKYFVDTISQDKTEPAVSVPIEQAFHVRRPYIDLGGNGVVFSLCRAITLRRRQDAALCMDFPVGEVPQGTADTKTLADVTYRRLADRITGLGGHPFRVHCKGTTKYTCLDDKHLPYPTIADSINTEHKGDTSEIFGKINTSYRSHSGALELTVPLSQFGDLLYAQIDVAPIQKRTLYSAAGFGTSVLLLMVSLALLIADYGMRLNQQNAAFQEVAAVMQHAAVPYCRLDADSHFIDANAAFLSMVDCPTKMELTGLDFCALLTPEGKIEYKKHLEERVEGKMSEYDLNLKKYDAVSRTWTETAKFSVRVVGAPVPVPQDPRGAKPQTFGIFKVNPGNVTRIRARA